MEISLSRTHFFAHRRQSGRAERNTLTPAVKVAILELITAGNQPYATLKDSLSYRQSFPRLLRLRHIMGCLKKKKKIENLSAEVNILHDGKRESKLECNWTA